MKNPRELMKNKKRIVIKVGSSTITHAATGNVNYPKLEKLVRLITDLKNEGKDVILVSSGAIAVGRQAIGLKEKPKSLSVKQACAAIGQASLMTIYQKLFSEYNQKCAQILLTLYTFDHDLSYENACNTFSELFKLNIVPIVNENDTVSTQEIGIGDNDTLSAYVASMTDSDLLILMSDIDGLYSDDPHKHKDAIFIETVEKLTDEMYNMAKGSASTVGTGGMQTKLHAAHIATSSGIDMVITNGEEVDNIRKIIDGENVGTLFMADKKDGFDFRKEIGEYNE